MASLAHRIASVVFSATACFGSTIGSAQSYTALAKTFLDAPLVAHVSVARVTPIKPGPAPSTARFYVVANMVALFRAPASQPPAIDLLVDLPRDSQGKPPRLKKAEWLIAARPAEAQVQLTSPPVTWTPELERRVRAILAEARVSGAPGAVRRVSGAFYSPGNVPGESETQIFLDMASGKGSLSVLRRPGIAPAWSASFGEVASDGPPPAKDTLGWYRLVCGLPAALPDSAVADLDEAGRTAGRADYAFILAQLGTCN